MFPPFFTIFHNFFHHFHDISPFFPPFFTILHRFPTIFPHFSTMFSWFSPFFKRFHHFATRFSAIFSPTFVHVASVPSPLLSAPGDRPGSQGHQAHQGARHQQRGRDGWDPGGWVAFGRGRWKNMGELVGKMWWKYGGN